MIDIFEVKPHVVSTDLSNYMFLFHGEGGTGKTSTACKFEKHLIAAFEPGYKLIDGAMGIPMNKWGDFKSLVRQLTTAKGKESYNTIIIDTIGLAYRSCCDYVAQVNGKDDVADIEFGKGYKKAQKEFEDAIMDLARAGFGIIIIAHSEEKDDWVTKEKKVKVDIDKRAYAVAQGLVDFNFYLKKDGVDETDGSPVTTAITIAKGVEVKSRVKLPEEFRFNYDNICKVISEGIQTEIVEKGGATVTDQAINLMEVKEIPFDELLADTVEMAQKLAVEAGTEVEQIIGRVLGRRLSEAKRIDKEKVQAINSELKSLEYKIENA